jgi:hypothetical protein
MPTSDPVTTAVPMHADKLEGRQHGVTDDSHGSCTENEDMKGVDVDGGEDRGVCRSAAVVRPTIHRADAIGRPCHGAERT